MRGMEPGYPPPQYQGGPPVKRTNGFGITALVMGLVGLILLPPLLGIMAIIFGAVGIGFANKNMGSGKGIAIAGLILGIVDLLWFFALLALVASS